MKNKMLLFASVGWTLISLTSLEARCFKGCQGDKEIKSFPKTSAHRYDEDRSNQQRENSHDVSNSKNSIGGDVFIWAGHEKLEIGDATNSTINASVTSIVNLGDTNNTGHTSNTTTNNHEKK